MLIASLLTVPGSAFCGVIVAFLSKLVPYKFDEYVLRFDSVFGDPSFMLGRFFAPHLWLQTILAMIYNLLPCAWLLVYAIYLWKASIEEADAIVRVYILFLVLALPIFLLFPVSGPYYAFAGFPFQSPQNLVPHPLLLSAPPNGVPSIHFATALVTVYFLRRWRIWCVASSVFLALTAIATLESGEHYLFDLLAAVPFSALVLLLAKIRRKGESLQAIGNQELAMSFPQIAGTAESGTDAEF